MINNQFVNRHNIVLFEIDSIHKSILLYGNYFVNKAILTKNRLICFG